MSIQGDPRLTLLNLQPVLNRLGVKGLAIHRWDPVVHPVAIVDGSIQAVGLQTLDVPFSGGELTAPAAGTRLANTGALQSGQYNITVLMNTGGDQAQIRIRRRNAGDTADIWAQRLQSTTAGFFDELVIRMVFATNEFLVVENVGAGNVGIVYQASIWVQGPF